MIEKLKALEAAATPGPRCGRVARDVTRGHAMRTAQHAGAGAGAGEARGRAPPRAHG